MIKGKILKTISCLMCFAVLLNCYPIFAVAATQPDATGDRVKVTFPFAFFRSEPDLSLAAIKRIFLRGKEVEVLGYSGSYVRVWDSDSESEGYIHYFLLNDKPLNIRQQYVNVYNGATKSNAVTVKYDEDGELKWSVSSNGIVEIIKTGKRSFSVKGISPGTVTLTVECDNDKDTCSITCINEWKDRETSTAKSDVKVMCAPGKYFSPEKVISEGATITVCGDIPNTDYFYVSSGSIWGYIYSSDFPDIKYMMTQYHYYDQGYEKRFGAAETKIYDYAAVLNDFMMANFGLKVCSYVEPYTSAADQCKIWSYGKIELSNLASPCPKNGMHNVNSCFERKVLWDKFKADVGHGDNTTIKLLWTGHILPNHQVSAAENGSESVVMTTANTVKYDKKAGTYTNKSSEEIRKFSLYTLTHETGHLLGTVDGYCKNDKADSSSDHCSNPNCYSCNQKTVPNCIMVQVFSPEEKENTFCDECVGIIQEHLNKHH